MALSGHFLCIASICRSAATERPVSSRQQFSQRRSGKTRDFMQPPPERACSGGGHSTRKGHSNAQISSCGRSRARDRPLPRRRRTTIRGYVGVEGGILFPKSQTISGDGRSSPTRRQPTFTRTSLGKLAIQEGLGRRFRRRLRLRHVPARGRTWLQARQDEGLQRQRRLRLPRSTPAQAPPITTTNNFGLSGSASVYSAMVNGLVDFGGNGSIGGYAGGGAGYANVKQFGDSQRQARLAAARRRLHADQQRHRYRPEVSLLPCRPQQLERAISRSQSPTRSDVRSAHLLGGHRDLRRGQPVHLAQPAREPRLQLRRSGCSAAAASSAAASAAPAAAGDADLPGRLGDLG